MDNQSLSSFMKLFEHFQALPNVYDVVRIVDPFQKKVFELRDGLLSQTPIDCHAFWNRSSACDNCTSCRAVMQQETFVKIENTPDSAYLLTSVPIMFENKKLAIELIKNINKSLYFTDSEQDTTVEVYSYIKGLNSVAVTDGLTGAYNRRFIDERLPADLMSKRLKHQPVSVVLADLDFFKRVNDTYGHSGGDFVLKEFCKLLKQGIRDDFDWVSRYGGEEFLLGLPNSTAEGAYTVAERVRSIVEAHTFLYDGSEIKITASFGVAEAMPGEEAEALLKRVDSLLYRAKENGRNRVEK